MATVNLTTLWLNDAATLSDAQQFPLMSALKVTVNKPGEVRTRANGRQVTVTRAGLPRTFAVTLPWCDRTQIAWLESKIGKTLLVRDDRGRKAFAVFYDLPVDEVGYTTEGNVTLALSEVTRFEAV